MGFNDKEIVALSGAHGLGACHIERSGFWGPWDARPNDREQRVLPGVAREQMDGEEDSQGQRVVTYGVGGSNGAFFAETFCGNSAEHLR